MSVPAVIRAAALPLAAEPSAASGAAPGARPADPSDELVVSVFARDCLSRAALENVSGKWATLALLALGEGDYRFNALRRKVQGVSEKMLSQTLQNLERDGMINREVRSTIPARVEYSLTPLGTEVAQRLRGLADLLEAAAPAVAQSRHAYDDRPR
jgi:DNA-binding HxlR family transcriptional regulator